ncbi:MAG: hypothetical protein IJE97_15265 [Thermoguttaceae bacterium]|nr:hypothetical protein [Thermoguttaceae bacterium]MBQ8286533.1 hypothetical protein [Thermoguttaceae bacterium]
MALIHLLGEILANAGELGHGVNATRKLVGATNIKPDDKMQLFDMTRGDGDGDFDFDDVSEFASDCWENVSGIAENVAELFSSLF